MINLRRIVEQQDATGQYYDLGRDFANFRRTIDGTTDQVKQKFEVAIGARLNGKRIRARASRGYKQYVKDYEFDVTRVTLDDYYDNYVVVAHDNTTPKAKEYFLKPGFKIQVLGPATGQPSPQKGGKPETTPAPRPMSPQQNPDKAQAQPMALAPAGHTPSEETPMKEDMKNNKHYDAYPIDAIAQDIKAWLPPILKKPETALRDFIKGLGWQTEYGHGKSAALYDLKIPTDMVKIKLTPELLQQIIFQTNKTDGTISIQFEVVKAEPTADESEWMVRIKKTMTDTTSL